MYQMDESNSGGVGAKKGFFYQDYVATFLTSEMLLDSRIKGIGCEIGDDIEIFHSDDSVTHVQVKAGTVDKCWNLTELKAARNFITDKKTQKKQPKTHSSVLHKSLEFDKDPNITSKFMIVSDMPVSGPLSFLEISQENRATKTGRDSLINSINTALGKKFQSGNGHRGEYWVDNTVWRVFTDIEKLVLKTEHNLRVACEELLNCTLTINAIRQLGEILCNRIYFKSQLSKKVFTSDDKTLFRDDAKALIRDFAFTNAHVPKAYPNKNLPEIVTQLFEERIDKQKQKGFIQGFNFNTYRYDHIVDMLVDWVDEVFLKPSEIANGSPSFNKTKNIRQRISELNLTSVISRTILNSILRSQHDSQPIPMIMFAANNTKCLKFDSVHIVSNKHDVNELWIGISEFINNSVDVFGVMESLCEKINDLIFIDMDKDRQIILESKDDKYLFKHDIDSILDTSNSFSSHLERFKFVIFISYQMTSYDYQTSEDTLVKEIKNKINHMYNLMITKNSLFSQVRLGFYVFPTPCNDTILNKFKSKISL